MSRYFLFLFSLAFLAGCSPEANLSDAYGNFEATRVTVGSEGQGRLLFLNVQEGSELPQGQLVGLVDTTQLHLQLLQLEATLGTLPKKLRTTIADIDVLKKQKENLVREQERVARLVERKAATTKQLDDINGQIEVVDKQIQAIRTNTSTANQAVLSEKEPMLAQMALIREQIRRCYIYNPVPGTVLTKLAESQEIVGPGAPLYQIAKLDTLDLRVYADASQLQQVRLGQQVEVLVDDGVADMKSLSGRVSWISQEAEFTPKSIQTKEERVNLVYAVKIRVANPDRALRIGMPAEVNFTKGTP